ncbi:hypothetical protein D3C80_2166740 [compost metagenome]
MPANRPSLGIAPAGAGAVPPVAVGTMEDRTLSADMGCDRAFARWIGAYCTRAVRKGRRKVRAKCVTC